MIDKKGAFYFIMKNQNVPFSCPLFVPQNVPFSCRLSHWSPRSPRAGLVREGKLGDLFLSESKSFAVPIGGEFLARAFESFAA